MKKIILTAIIICNFFLSGCSKECTSEATENEKVTVTKDLDIDDVCVSWGMSVSEVQKTMTEFILSDISDDNTIAYEAKKDGKKRYVIYRFVDSRLYSSIVISESIEFPQMLLNYGYSFAKKQEGDHVYYNNKNNVMAVFYRINSEKMSYMVIGFMPLTQVNN